jgi:hypothetical protein
LVIPSFTQFSDYIQLERTTFDILHFIEAIVTDGSKPSHKQSMIDFFNV